MPVHLVIITYLADLDVIDAAIAEHGAWLDQNYADGVFLASGRQEPRTGGVILADGLTLEGLNERLALDPFQQQGLAEYAEGRRPRRMRIRCANRSCAAPL